MSLPNDTRTKLEDILNHREYQAYYESETLLELWWGKAKAWIMDLLTGWFPALEPSDSIATMVLIIVMILVVVLLITVSLLIMRRIKRRITYSEHKPLRSMIEMNWSAEMHLLEAKKQESLQHYALSSRHLFLALLLYFQERDWLEVRLWKTNGEYYEDLMKKDDHKAALFYQSAIVFDRVTYGQGDIHKEEFILLRDAVMGWLDHNMLVREEE